MPRRTLAIATIAAALLWGCAGDGNGADPIDATVSGEIAE